MARWRTRTSWGVSCVTRSCRTFRPGTGPGGSNERANRKGLAAMLTTTIIRRGLTAADFARAAVELKPELARLLETIMNKARVRMTALASGQVLHRRSGRTAMAISRGRVSSEIGSQVVRGLLTHRGLLLNIHEGGASMPTVEIRPRRRKALKFRAGGTIVFVH